MLCDGVGQVHNFVVADEGALHTLHVYTGVQEHIAAANQFVCARLVQDGGRVDAGGNAERDTHGEVGLDKTGNDVYCRALGGQDAVQTGCTAFLGQTDNRGGNHAGLGLGFRRTAAGHGEVCVLIDDHHNVRHEVVTFVRTKMMVFPLAVVQFDIVHIGLGQELVAGIHFHAQRIEDGGGVLGIFDDGFFCLFLLAGGVGQHGQVMVQQMAVGGELHHLGVYEHEFEF